MSIIHPVPASEFPSAAWWAELASSTQAAIDAAAASTLSSAATQSAEAVTTARTALEAAIAGKAPADHTHTAAQVSDASEDGRRIMRSASFANMRTLLGLELVVGGVLGTTDLNTVTTPGFHRQAATANATPARNYPIAQSGTLTVEQRDSAAGVQTYRPLVNGVGIFVRNWTNYGSSWSAWEQLVPTNDTGRRRIDSLAVNGWTVAAFVRRIGNVVDLTMSALNGSAATDDIFLIVPNGFRDNGNHAALSPVSGGWTGSSASATPLNIRSHYSTGALYCGSRPGGAIFRYQYLTADPWPTTLPGTPA